MGPESRASSRAICGSFATNARTHGGAADTQCVCARAYARRERQTGLRRVCICACACVCVCESLQNNKSEGMGHNTEPPPLTAASLEAAECTTLPRLPASLRPRPGLVSVPLPTSPPAPPPPPPLPLPLPPRLFRLTSLLASRVGENYRHCVRWPLR